MNIRFPSLLVLIVSTTLSGCVVASEDSWTAPIATTTNVGVVGSNAVFYYSLDDGYYYDQHYHRLPYTYRPDRYALVHRIHNIDDYRRRYQGVRQKQNHPMPNNHTHWDNRYRNRRWETQNHQTNNVRGKNTQGQAHSKVQHPTLINRQTGQRIQSLPNPIRRSGSVGFRSGSSPHSIRPNPNWRHP